MSNIKNFFSQSEKENIVNAIKLAEKETSGEIRVHIDKKCKEDVLDRASFIFEKLEMHKTELRNGVLFYLAVNDRKFAILGDAGINNVVPKDFWEEVKQAMLKHFKSGNFSEGLIKGITMAGEKLKAFFPYKSDDINELDDDISFGK
jgi:uncharacterized membrane protein